MNEDKAMVLYKNKFKIKFDCVVNKGSSFVICLKIIPEILNQVNIGTEEKLVKNKKSINFMEYRERLGHPSEELTIVMAKSQG